MHFHLQKPIVNRLKSPYLAHLSLFNLFTDLLFPTPSLSGKSYIVTFVDDHSRKLWGYSIRNKSDVYETFKAWKCEVGNASENSIITLRMDNGGEFTSTSFNTCIDHGIHRDFTIPYTPEQNARAERLS